MDIGHPSNTILCDGCGLAASAEHIAERLGRLELATRFRPIHMGVLFVAASPLLRPEEDFYRPPVSREFFGGLMEAVEISVPGNGSPIEADPSDDVARLLEFQRRGYYLAYLSECPLPPDGGTVNAAILRLGSTLIRRIRFNYRPRQVVLLGSHLRPLHDIFEKAGVPTNPFETLETTNLRDPASSARFKALLANLSPSGDKAI